MSPYPKHSAVISTLAALATLSVSTPALAQNADQTFHFTDAAGEVIEAGVWLPDQATGVEPRPLVVISHGNGGGYQGHHDTADALAEAGFVVAALTHPGDNWRDDSRQTRLTDRPGHVSLLIDHMTQEWPGPLKVDATRIGAFGFSAGGFTVTGRGRQRSLAYPTSLRRAAAGLRLPPDFAIPARRSDMAAGWP
jgi:predicted dienelactone hydrolase